jgi:predicted GNAT family N-acyltransferase
MARDGEGQLAVRFGTGVADVAALHDLRRRVFVEEFGLSERMVTTPTDPDDAHVIAWVGERAVGCLTLCETTADPGAQRTYHLPADGGGRSFRFTKLAIVPEWRRTRLAALLMVAGQCWVIDPAAPLFTWLVVYECQYRHIPLYAKFGFQLHGETTDAIGPCRVLIRADCVPITRHLLDTLRPLAEALFNRFGVEAAS